MPRKQISIAKHRKPAKRSIGQHAKHLIVPHKRNHYQPHLIRGKGIAIVVAFVFVIQGFYNLSNTGSVLGGEANVTTETLLSETNTERAEHGQAPLKLNKKLALAADMKAKDMLSKQYWAHNSPDGTEPWNWFKKAEYSYDYAGENLAKSFTTSEGVIRAWMNSPEHRNNVLGENYKDVGFAVVPGELNDENTMLVVALYAAPKTAQAVATAAPAVLAASGQPQPIIGQVGMQLQSMSPAALASIVLLLLTTCVALAAHSYRKKLPNQLLKSWRRHHGAYKALGMASLAVIFITLYGGGQI